MITALFRDLVLLVETLNAAHCLSVLSGAFVGFLWMNARKSDDHRRVENVFGSGPSICLITVTGTSVLSAWNVETIGPCLGLFWIIGIVMGAWSSSAFIIKAYAAPARNLFEEEREEIRALVARTIFEKKHTATEKIVDARIAKIKREHSRISAQSIEMMHAMVHSCRDGALEYFSFLEQSFKEVLNGQAPLDQKETQEQLNRYLREVAARILDLFSKLVGSSTPLWVALRTYDSVEGRGVYKTILRYGRVNNTNREKTSVAVPADSGLPKFLRHHYDRGNGIIILNDHQPIFPKGNKDAWVEGPNDARAADRSIIAGPIMIKKPGKTSELGMILYVCSNYENVFNERHQYYMRCCTDTLSLFFSAIENVVRVVGVRDGRP